jgi:hypothetical protein
MSTRGGGKGLGGDIEGCDGGGLSGERVLWYGCGRAIIGFFRRGAIFWHRWRGRSGICERELIKGRKNGANTDEKESWEEDQIIKEEK